MDASYVRNFFLRNKKSTGIITLVNGNLLIEILIILDPRIKCLEWEVYCWWCHPSHWHSKEKRIYPTVLRQAILRQAINAWVLCLWIMRTFSPSLPPPQPKNKKGIWGLQMLILGWPNSKVAACTVTASMRRGMIRSNARQTTDFKLEPLPPLSV